MFECTRFACRRASSMNCATASLSRASSGRRRLRTNDPREALDAGRLRDEQLRHAAFAQAVDQAVAAEHQPTTSAGGRDDDDRVRAGRRGRPGVGAGIVGVDVVARARACSPNFSVVSWMIWNDVDRLRRRRRARRPCAPPREQQPESEQRDRAGGGPAAGAGAGSSGGAPRPAAASCGFVGRPSTRTGSPSGASASRAAPSRYGCVPIVTVRRRDRSARRAALTTIRFDAGPAVGSAGGDRRRRRRSRAPA